MLTCCEKCKNYTHCERKWILGEKGINPSCCVECEEFNVCIEKNTLERWDIIHGKMANKKKSNNIFL
ncbi:MAG: hypothetical protein QMD92_02645 [bacterium]|nr:hypothetical protein [bacterium]